MSVGFSWQGSKVALELDSYPLVYITLKTQIQQLS